LPKALGRLQTLLQQGLQDTASLWPEVQVTYGWVHRAAPILNHEDQRSEAAVQQRLHGLLGAMTRHCAKAGTLAPAVDHFLKVSHNHLPPAERVV
jgi:hypothetical protein